MDISTLNALCQQGEGESIEFKRDTSSPRFEESFCRTVCAFANDLADRRETCYFLIGIEDDGAISGYRDTAKDEERLASWISAWKVTPKPAATLETVKTNKGDVTVVCVEPSSHPTWYNKEMWVRVGKTTRKADLTDMLRSNSKSKPQSFDACVVPQSHLSDIAGALFVAYETAFVSSDIIEANHRNLLQKLIGQGFADPYSERPTYAGILVCGKEPQRQLPLGYIQFLRVSGLDLLDRHQIIDHKPVRGDIANQVREVESLIRAHTETWFDTQHTDSQFDMPKQSTYPFQAIRELLMNAIIHRDYSMATPIHFYWYADRIEIKSPGELFRPTTPAAFPWIASYRNPLIAAAMKNLGFIEHFGTGVQLTQKLLRDNGNPPAVFEFNDVFVKVTIYAKQKIA